jgi:hypothetical protein
MKKIIIISSLIIVLSILFGAVIYMVNPLLRSEEKIREQLLESTPIGTKMESVIKFVEGKKKWEIDDISYDHGFLHQGKSPSERIGGKSIQVFLGDSL